MLTGRTRLALFLSLLTLGALPGAAAAAPAAATISACRTDSVTVAGKVALTGSAARRARGASLELRFQATPLFGLPRSGQWKKRGRKTRATGQEVFGGLNADSWVGVMNWRYKKGRKTVLSGIERSQPVRVGSARGRASCTIAEGVKPVDKTPPALLILPADENWHRAPAAVQLSANDDFSGVKSVSYSVNGGARQPIANGGTFSIPDQGQHPVDWEATDVAGNTATRSAVVRVDGAPPTKPAFVKPPSVTKDVKPTFQWSASTDTGSGMAAYVLIIKRGDGSIVSFQPVGAATTSVQSAVTLNDGESYTAVVTAVDNTVDTPWTTDSDPLAFRVDSSADASFAPANGTILSGSAKSTNFTITLDRPADPATVSPTTVKLRKGDGSEPAHSAGCSNTPCTVIVVDPNSDLGEGHYTLSLNGVKSADEGLTFGGSANYAVPYVENGSIAQSTASSVACPVSGDPVPTSTAAPVSAADPGTRAFLEFDITYSGAGGWTVQAKSGSTVLGELNGAAAGHYRLEFPSTSGGTLTFTLQAHCAGGTTTSASASNLFGSRIP